MRKAALPFLAVAVVAGGVLGGAAGADLGGRGHATAVAHASGNRVAPRARSLRISRLKSLVSPGVIVGGGRILTPSAAALAKEAFGPLMGWLAPVAVSSPDRTQVVYSTWRQLRRDDPRLSWSDQGIKFGDALGRPALRRYDLVSGADSLIEEGAFSAAWRSDGALAYLRGSQPEYRAGERYIGDVVVRGTATAPAEVWSEAPDRYVVAAWAGTSLIAYRIGEGERLDLIAFDGPQQQRVLAEDSDLVAVSPDGRSVFVNHGSAIPASVRVLDVATGDELARLTLGEIAGTLIPWVGYAGSWAGDLVVAGTEEGVLVFRVRRDSIEPSGLLLLDKRLFPHGAVEPAFVDDGSGRFVVRADARAGPEAPTPEYLTTLLDCELATATCARAEAAPERAWLRFVSNPSRPQREQ